MDVLRLEVLWNRLLSVVNEQQVTLMRTAFSTVVRESQDLACGVFDRNANMMAQSLTGTPGHINTMATGMRHFMAAHPPDTLEPGDVLITNDPWQTAGQINDMTVVTPVFHRGRVVAFFASCCHSPDVGGRVYGGSASEIYEEGIRIPIMYLMRRGVPNETLVAMVRANVRVPDETVGDLWAQMACNDVGARDLVHFLEEFDLPDCEELSQEIIRRSESALREAIRAVPDGTYTNEAWSDGFNDLPVHIVVAVTVAGDSVGIDYTGSSGQSPSGINVVLNYTQAYSSFAIKAALNPEVPHNEGAFRPVTTTAPLGSILNCQEPAAVAARHLIGHMLPCTIFGALAKAMPGRLMAGGAESSWLTVWRGTWPGRADLFTFTLFQSGGAGARARKDGLQTNGFPSGVAGVPVEVYETRTPLIMHRKELLADSGGAGRWRGGLAMQTESSYRGDGTWGVSTIIDRLKFAGQGIAGGKPGSLGEYVLDTGEHPPAKTLVQLALDDHVHLRLAGGAGYGEPLSRPAEEVLRDVVLGFVTIAAAEREYAVVVRYTGGPDRLVRLPEHYAIDAEATARLRGAE